MMAEILSAEQVREKHIRSLGPELGAVYNALWKDVAWLHAKWNQYRQLYGHSPERIALLNRVAGHFFAVIQDSLLEDVLLHLVRLTDHPKRNLTLKRLPKLVADPTLAAELGALVKAACRACECPRAWRHRRLAHRDLALALGTSSDLLPGVSRAEVEAALQAVRAVLNRLEAQYWQAETAYQHFLAKPGDADALVYYLLKGTRAEQQRLERFRRGRPLPEDLEPEDHV